MQYFVVLTKECNLLCKYCGGGSDTPPKEIQYSIENLKSFLSKDVDPSIEFYGGEPLLRIGKMKDIMDSVDARYMVQTNGLLLDRIEPNLLVKFHTILVSIDGTKMVTDSERGVGVYERVIRNSRLIRERGFAGDLVARMTVENGTDIEENVLHLWGTGLFDHVHWQLSFSMFWKGEVEVEPSLSNWITNYNSGVTRLVNWWVTQMKQTQRVPGIVPFLGITDTLLNGEEVTLRCGSGMDSFAVIPDGRISACPVSVDFDFSILGSILTSTPLSVVGKAGLGEPCLSCGVYEVCGGRCLFVNRVQWMLREEGYSLICQTVKHLVSELKLALPVIRGLIDDGFVDRTAFAYPEFNNGCEIIP